MRVLILLIISVGVFAGFGTSQPAPAADFVVEAGKISNNKVRTWNKAMEAADRTNTLFFRAIKRGDTDTFFKLVAHTEEDKKHVKEIFAAWRKKVSMSVRSAEQSGDDKIIALVRFTFNKKDDKKTEGTGNVVLTKNTDSPTGWIIAQFPERISITRVINNTIVAN
ncbi:hypothetical protein CAEBREN_09727 [Caenorhabditis brenneri]|uniref:Uncharacterized protein n=1 Tax=Caenorhabditis brenneri TaxID=135651 RepID=G0MQK4_CAEBE|nr:hypothetical protein CAEBREN_09727 [Caenorhabditis brenneri]